MSKYKQTDMSGVRTISIRSRKSKVVPADFAKPIDANEASFQEFVDSLPHILIGQELRDLVGDIITSVKKGAPVILMMGAHVIKVGMAPIIVD
ncbi:MAG TPA: hypothetical protein VI758_08490, partial [Bacteroidota bacterium]